MTRIGIEIRRTEMRGVCLDGGDTVSDVSVRTFDANRDPVEQVSELVENLPKEAGTDLCVGIAIPGLVNRNTGLVTFSGSLSQLQGVDFRQSVTQKIFGKVILENDANSAAYAELKRGAGTGATNLFYVTLDQGVGAGLILNNELWRGDSGFAGEFGSMVVNTDDVRLQDLVNSSNVIRRTLARLHQDPTSSLHTIDEEKMTIGNIVDAANADDGFAQMMLERTGTFAGSAIASVINLLNVGTIIVGGDVIDDHGFVLDAMREKAQSLAYTESFETVKIVRGMLGKDAPAIGAALLAGEACSDN